jgi:hypothetical protein
MDLEEVRQDILVFMYAERLKSALIVAGELVDVLADLGSTERSGGLKVFGSFVRAVGGEIRLAAHVVGSQDLQKLDERLKLVEGYVRLGQMEVARQELSRTLSSVTTSSGYAMTSLKDKGLL